jgi:2-polyprenyl-6-methoxyphenol hydroxylase-like FAD-dependent oxidoreductase
LDVLIVGAGPTGLVLALWLTRLGVRVRIVDKAAEPGTTSRALAVQARTLELYQQIGLADAVVQGGRRGIAANMWVSGHRVARAPLGDMGAGISPYPFALIFPQDEHERLLSARLAHAGITVERGAEFLGIEETDSHVTARLRRSDGSLDTCRAAYLAGCDGARSALREALSIGFPGGTYAHTFYVADVTAAGPAMNGEVHVALDEADFLVVFPLEGDRRARLVGTLREGVQAGGQELSWSDVGRRVIEWMHVEVAQVNWFSTHHVHHRVAGRFRAGRAFLLGDAAHIHSPVGGQGMNTGIGDAVNLAWKLAAVLRARADPTILDTYEAERIAFARRLVATTDRAFTAATGSGALARLLRLRVVPLVVPLLFRSGAFRRLAFRTVSQTAVNYRGSWLSLGHAGSVHGGDRLPWVQTSSTTPSGEPRAASVDLDNFAALRSLDWQVHVYGVARPAIKTACERRRLALHVFGWRSGMRKSGLSRDALYLVRPDGYVALAARGEEAARALDSYLDGRKLGTLGGPN